MKITIDNLTIEVTDLKLNIVEIARQNKIGIPSPCYNNKRKFGCCNACVIEINGEQKYACVTKPYDGMKIIFKRDDLAKLRKERLKEYILNVKNNIKAPCDCSNDCPGDSCGDSCCGND